MRWDLYCRVIDNHGDLGVCWRLACDLARRGETVRLWVDDASALGWMAPDGAPGVQVMAWRELQPGESPGDVVVEAFGCDPPSSVLQAMGSRAATGQRPPVWINLEYLSAEPYVERSHGLPSPQAAGPARGLTKWFYYPGFTPRTGGLLRETELRERLAGFDVHASRRTLGLDDPTRRCALLFCYDNPRLACWLDALGATSADLLVTPGHAARQVGRRLGSTMEVGQAVTFGLATARAMPYTPQVQFDQALWTADFALVRGEDSLVRALWSGRPFVWQLYPQHDAAHHAKLEAFLAWYLDGAPAAVRADAGAWHRWWNGLEASTGTDPWPAGSPPWPGEDWTAWARERSVAAWGAVPDLTAGLIGFVAGKG